MAEPVGVPPALAVVRARLEEIDRSLLLLLAARIEVANIAIRVRSEIDGRVSNPAQERLVLARGRRLAHEVGLSPELAESVLRDVIDAGKVQFYSRAGPAEPLPPDLPLRGRATASVRLAPRRNRAGEPCREAVALPL